MAEVILDQVTKRFGDFTAVNRLRLHIRDGSFFTLLGPSGCGKTTTLRMISGFVFPDEGTVRIGREEVTYTAPEKRKIGMVFQNYALFPHLNVFDNVAYGLKIQKLRKSEIASRVQKYLRMVELEGYENRNISELSGGQQQRVALARSLAPEPRILLLDEPLSNLDAKLRENMRMELKQIQKELGITTLYVTHDQTEALTMSDEIAVFDRGVCQQTGTPQEVYGRPANAFVAGFIGETNLYPVKRDGNGYTIGGKIPLRTEERQSGSYASIRPASLRLARSAGHGPNEWEGTVKWEQYYGSHTTYVIDVRGLELKVHQTHSSFETEPFRIGEPVFVSVHPRDILLVPEAKGENSP